jgi:MFS family permease
LLVTLGALGAVSATVPAQIVLDLVGWRGLFLLIAWLTAVSAVFIFLGVPEKARSPISQGAVTTLGTIFRDRRFWKLAPMSATCIGTAWALQGLWASPWLSVVERYDRPNVVQALFVMALSLSAAGLSLGFLADRLRSKGISTETLFAGVVAVFMFAQLCLLLRVSFIPPIVLWALIGAIGAATVLAYAILPTYFSREASGRANAALNILHVGVAFSVQWLIGVAIDLWPIVNGRHPVEAYQLAFGANLVVQSIAFIWFLVPPMETRSSARQTRIRIPNVLDAHAVPKPHCPYRAARQDWLSRTQDAQAQAHAWRAAALMSMTLCIVLGTLVVPR